MYSVDVETVGAAEGPCSRRCQEEPGGGYGEGDGEDDEKEEYHEEEKCIDDAEPASREEHLGAKGMRVALGRGVAPTALTGSRVCMTNVRRMNP